MDEVVISKSKKTLHEQITDLLYENGCKYCSTTASEIISLFHPLWQEAKECIKCCDLAFSGDMDCMECGKCTITLKKMDEAITR